MPTPPMPRDKAEALKAAIEEALRKGYPPPGKGGKKPGAARIAIMAAGYSIGSVSNVLNQLQRLGIEPDWSLYGKQETKVEIPDKASFDLVSSLRRNALTLDQIATQTGISRGQALDMIDSLKADGINVHEIGGKWSIEKAPQPAYIEGATFEYVSRPDNTFVMGVTSDNHLGSKYTRLDVLNSLYDRFAEEGVDRVFNAGNWIDGEARFNKFDLEVHGMESQVRYLAKHYPRRPGLHTFAVAGDDHEGWYAQREGVNIGKYAERVMRENGREDWHDLGYMEAHVRLKNANSGKEAVLAVVHPGGGSAYAYSYTVQKIVESLDGGEKPAAAFYGHYHKLWSGNIRNVWVVQTGCTEDQTPFMRKKRLEAHVGGGIIKFRQDPKTGALVEMSANLLRYFNRGYYNDRWSHSDPVNLPERSL
jgi:biotin operon repressor